MLLVKKAKRELASGKRTKSKSLPQARPLKRTTESPGRTTITIVETTTSLQRKNSSASLENEQRILQRPDLNDSGKSGTEELQTDNTVTEAAINELSVEQKTPRYEDYAGRPYLLNSVRQASYKIRGTPIDRLLSSDEAAHTTHSRRAGNESNLISTPRKFKKTAPNISTTTTPTTNIDSHGRYNLFAFLNTTLQEHLGEFDVQPKETRMAIHSYATSQIRIALSTSIPEDVQDIENRIVDAIMFAKRRYLAESEARQVRELYGHLDNSEMSSGDDHDLARIMRMAREDKVLLELYYERYESLKGLNSRIYNQYKAKREVDGAARAEELVAEVIMELKKKLKPRSKQKTVRNIEDRYWKETIRKRPQILAPCGRQPEKTETPTTLRRSERFGHMTPY